MFFCSHCVCVCTILTGRYNEGCILHLEVLFRGSRILCKTDTEEIKHLVMSAMRNFASFIGI